MPSCVKAKHQFEDEEGPYLLDKSYSPVSLPDQEDYFELLIKGYPPRPKAHGPVHGKKGGLAAHLVGLQPGQTAHLALKNPRLFHGKPYETNRWSDLCLLAGGTGIAPLLQMIRTILADPLESTRLWLVFANNEEQDILMRDELDAMAARYPSRMSVRYVLARPPEQWSGGTGYVAAEDVVGHVPPPSQENMQLMVCGRDEFLEAVSGMTARGPPPPGKKKGPKIQGELKGLLKDLDYRAEQVYKF